MSTILDALKKVEQERKSDTSAAQQRQLEALQSAPEAKGRRRTRNGLIVGLLVVVCLIMGAVTYYLFRDDLKAPGSRAAVSDNRHIQGAAVAKKPESREKTSNSKTPPSPKTRPQKPQPKATPPAESPPKAAVPSPTVTNRANMSRAENQQDRRRANPKARWDQTTSQSGPGIAPSTAAPVSRNGSANQSTRTELPSPAQASSQNTASQQPPQSRNTQATPMHSHIERLADGSLTVQAIAWSPIADERMAVINNKIVREGSSVDDYTLVTIGQDDVVVRKGGNEWRVVIGRP